MKKLLIITDMYPSDANPVSGVFVRHQVRYLREFYRIKVISAQFPGTPGFSMRQDEGTELISIRYPQLRFFPLNIINYRRFALPHVRSVIRDWKPDLIHVHDCRHIPELFSLAGVLKGYPGRTFLTAHNLKTLPSQAETWLHKFIYQHTLKAAYTHWTHIWFVNKRLQHSLAALLRIQSSSVIGNALPAFCPVDVPNELCEWLKPDHFKIIAAGNLVKTKGFELLVKAVAANLNKGNKLQLAIVGEGPERLRLSAMIKDLHLQEHIRLTGALDNTLLRSYYPRFGAFVLPSYSETFGIVYLEAMQAGLPVVGVKGQGIDGIVEDGVSGLLLNPRQQSDLEDKLGWLVANPDARKQLALLGKKLVEENFQMPQLIAKIRAEYEA